MNTTMNASTTTTTILL